MRKDNRGLSLVELIIAIVILAIVSIPFLRSFVTSANTNQKAKRIMRATSVAENVMEAMKPLTLEEIVLQLSNDGDEAHMPVCTLVPVFDGHQELLIEENENVLGSGITYSAVYENGAWKFLGQESDKYYFALTGIELDNTKYDARICLDASDYYAAAGETTPGYNDEEMVQISGLDLSKDVVFELEVSSENKVYAEFAERSSRYVADISNAKNADDFKAALTRKISIEIKQVDMIQEVHLTLTYTAPAGWVADDEREYSRTMQLYSGEISNPLRNIYILYPPNYYSMAGSIKDVFEIKNLDKVNCGIFLIKQVTASAANLTAAESFYVPRVELYEAASIDENTLPPVVWIYNNFNVNLGLRTEGYANYTMADPAEYVYNSQTGDPAKDMLNLMDILAKQSELRIFKTEIKIYDAGAFDATYSTFDESKHIVTLSN